MTEVKLFHHGRFALAGGTLPDAFTAYQTFGNPKNPCIVYMTCCGGRLDDKGPFGQWLVNEDLALDPRRYFIVNFALFGNGESSSPSNTPSPYNGPYFPRVTYEDNIRAQYNVLTKELGISKIFCAIGASMGGQQAYHWAALYPDFVQRIVSICSSARTSPQCAALVDSMKFSLVSAKDYEGGLYTSVPRLALSSYQRMMNVLAYSHEFFAKHLYLRGNTYTDFNDWQRTEAEGAWINVWDANDLLTEVDTWQHGDISKTSRVSPELQGNLVSALGGIKATTLLIPCKTDLFFSPEDSKAEVQAMKHNGAKLAIIPSIFGHGACTGYSPEDNEFISNQIKEFFESS